MNREDLDISIDRNTLRIVGEKHSLGEHQDRQCHLMERAYGRFERTIPLPASINQELGEVSYNDGVITVILPKTEALPPRHLSIPASRS